MATPHLHEIIDRAHAYFRAKNIKSRAINYPILGDLHLWSRKIEQLEISGKPHYYSLRKGSSLPYDIQVYKYQDFEFIKVTWTFSSTELTIYVLPEGEILKGHILSKNVDRSNVHENELRPVLEEKTLQRIKGLIEPLFGDKAKKFREYGCFVKRGILLHGPPGNGKSMMANYLSELPYFLANCEYFVGNFIKQDFEDELKYCSLAIFDDIDMNLFDRKSGGPIVSQFLSILDKSIDNRNQVRIFTTNEPIDAIDPAFLRPGRIDTIIHLGLPSDDLRRTYLNRWHTDITSNLDIDQVVQITNDWSFAQLNALKTNLVNRFILNGRWELDDSIEDVIVGNQPKKKKKAGF